MLCYGSSKRRREGDIMEIIRDLDRVNDHLKGCVLTVGNFDGVHIAHQRIISQVVREARERGGKSVIMTFNPHPQEFLHPERKPFYLITTLSEKFELLEEMGVDAVAVINFSADFSRLSADEFIRGIIWRLFGPAKILIGHDNTFGRGKEGKPAYVKQLGEKLGFDVEIIEAVCMEGLVVSSTEVRNAVREGDMRLAGMLLGRPYSLEGRVVEGFQRGRDIGFPTANIAPQKELLPGRGVYATLIDIEGERFESVTNVGFNPTFTDEKRLSIETHIFDLNRDVYGKRARVHFLEHLRGERKFESIDKLTAQIANDIARARAILKICAEK